MCSLTLPRNIRSLVALLGALCTLVATPANAQFGEDESLTDINPTDVIHWQPVGGQIYKDGIIEIGVRLFTEQNFTLYKEKVKFASSEGFKIKRVDAPPTVRQQDPITLKEVDVYTGGDFVLFLSAIEAPKGETIPLAITYLGCTSKICLFPYTENLKVPVYKTSQVSPFADNPVSEDSAEASAVTPSQPEEDLEQRFAGLVASGKLSLFMLLLVVFLGGLMTNVTPCVAPMIPITIRLLGNQKMPPLVSSSLYASGIMITYTALGAVAVFSGSAFGTFMSSVPLNIAFAVVMALLGLSMLGFGNLTFLQTLGARVGAGKPSAKNTFLMGAGAGLVAAPCTGPILGALLTYTTGKGDPSEGLMLMTTYSFGFALPYVFLGGAASKASTARIPHQIQLFIKVLFAAVMFGLALYYLRVPFYGAAQSLKAHWGELATYSLPIGTILLVGWLFKPTLHHSKLAMVIPALFLGAGLFAGSQWLTSGQGQVSKVKWYKSKTEAFAAARKENKPILMDHWAEWCEACKKMDITTFADPEVLEELKSHWIPLKLDMTEDTDAHDEHMDEYGINGLPTLVLLPAAATVEGSTNVVGYVSAQGLLKRLRTFEGH